MIKPFCISSKELTLNDVNNEGDSSDSENEIEEDGVHSSDDDELSFESDEEGNYQQNLNKQPLSDASDSEEEFSEQDPDLEDEEVEKDANEGDLYENDESDELSFEEGNAENDEYEKHDTDDEEDIRNTVGNIPMHWYDEYKHIGYDWDAKKIIKPAKRDQLDDFLKRMEDPNFWRTVKDPQTGQDVVLSEADIDLIKRINSRRIPDANFDDYAVYIVYVIKFSLLRF